MSIGFKIESSMILLCGVHRACSPVDIDYDYHDECPQERKKTAFAVYESWNNSISVGFLLFLGSLYVADPIWYFR